MPTLQKSLDLAIQTEREEERQAAIAGRHGGRPLQAPKNSLMKRKRLVRSAHPTESLGLAIQTEREGAGQAATAGRHGGRPLQMLKQVFKEGKQSFAQKNSVLSRPGDRSYNVFNPITWKVTIDDR